MAPGTTSGESSLKAGIRKHAAVLLNGFIVAAPILVTVYVVGTALWGLDKLLRAGLQHIWTDPWSRISEKPFPGIGIVVGVGMIYAVGVFAQSFLLGHLIKLAEHVLDRIPLVKSLYSAVRDLLQFLGGAKGERRGRPAVVRSPDGTVLMLGLVTQTEPGQYLPVEEDRVAVYLPMSYQLGGYTVYVPRGAVQEVEGLTVEDVMRLALTAGVGAAKPGEEEQGGPAPSAPA